MSLIVLFCKIHFALYILLRFSFTFTNYKYIRPHQLGETLSYILSYAFKNQIIIGGIDVTLSSLWCTSKRRIFLRDEQLFESENFPIFVLKQP